MVDSIGRNGSLAQEAVRAALRSVSADAARVQSAARALGAPTGVGPEAAPAAGRLDFAEMVKSGVQEVDGALQRADGLAQDLVTGKIDDFHEVAAQLKTADLSFKLALEVRNKLVEAYREVMRMSV